MTGDLTVQRQLFCAFQISYIYNSGGSDRPEEFREQDATLIQGPPYTPHGVGCS